MARKEWPVGTPTPGTTCTGSCPDGPDCESQFRPVPAFRAHQQSWLSWASLGLGKCRVGIALVLNQEQAKRPSSFQVCFLTSVERMA